MGTAPVGRHGAAGLVGILGCACDVGVTRSVVGGGNGEGHTMKGLEYHAEGRPGSSAPRVCRPSVDCFSALSRPFLALLYESEAGP